MAKISIATVLYNEEAHLPLLLESLVQQVIRKAQASDFELILIDNASTDRTLEILNAFAQENPQISTRVIQREVNHLADARNQALREARRDWVCFVDGDTLLTEGWWSGVQSALGLAKSDVALIGGQSTYEPQQMWHQALRLLAAPFPLGKRKIGPSSVPHVPTNNCLVRRQRALASGGFSLSYNRVGEDLDLSLALRHSGAILLYVPSFSVIHRAPQSRWSWYKKMFLYGQAQTRVLRKRGWGLPLVKFLPLVFVFSMLIGFTKVPLLTLFILLLSVATPILGPLVLSVLFYGLGEAMGVLPERLDLEIEAQSTEGSGVEIPRPSVVASQSHLNP